MSEQEGLRFLAAEAQDRVISKQTTSGDPYAAGADAHLLMGLQHVDSKLALGGLSILSPRDLVAEITHEDVERLDAVPGVGAEVADRIVR